MQTSSARSCFCLAVMSLALSGAFAAENYNVDVSIDYATKYIWRGFDYNAVLGNGDDQSAFQPSITYSLPSGLSFNVWASMNLAAGQSLDEVDYTIDYSLPVGEGLDLSLGHIYYDYPALAAGPGDATAEFYLGLTSDVPLNPSLFVYYDYDEGDGLYANLSLNHDFVASVFPNPVTFGASVGYFNGYPSLAGSDFNGVSDVALSLSTQMPLSRDWTWSPTLTYIFTSTDVNTEDEFVIGLNLNKSW